MTILRIRARSEQGGLAGRAADFSDIDVRAVDRDGNESAPMTNIERIEIIGSASPEPLRAIVTFVGLDLDLDAEQAIATDDDGETSVGDTVTR